MDFKLICELQLSFIQEIENKHLDPPDKIKYARILITNYKKAKQILKARVILEGDWAEVLRVAQEGLVKIVESLSDDLFHADDMKSTTLISYVDLLTQIQFLDFEDELMYKEVDGGLEDEIDMSLFKGMV